MQPRTDSAHAGLVRYLHPMSPAKLYAPGPDSRPSISSPFGLAVLGHVPLLAYPGDEHNLILDSAVFKHLPHSSANHFGD
jgi:hypothetical protein